VIGWPFDPTVYAGLVAAYLGHAWLARNAPDADRKHTLYLIAGLAALWLALETPIDIISDRYLDSVHMLQHVLLGFIAPPLILLSLSPTMVGRLVRIPGLRFITEAIAAQVIAGAVMVVWHLPALYNATLYSEDLHIVEHLTFIAAGLLLYWPIIEATSLHSKWHMSAAGKLVYLLLATLPQDGVALVLIFSRAPFYDFYVTAPRLVDGFTAVIDQTVAGAVLMILGKTTLAVAALTIFFRWVGGEQRADRRIDLPVRVR
jgi:putative membrane protein